MHIKTESRNFKREIVLLFLGAGAVLPVTWTAARLFGASPSPSASQPGKELNVRPTPGKAEGQHPPTAEVKKQIQKAWQDLNERFPWNFQGRFLLTCFEENTFTDFPMEARFRGRRFSPDTLYFWVRLLDKTYEGYVKETAQPRGVILFHREKYPLDSSKAIPFAPWKKISFQRGANSPQKFPFLSIFLSWLDETDTLAEEVQPQKETREGTTINIALSWTHRRKLAAVLRTFHPTKPMLNIQLDIQKPVTVRITLDPHKRLRGMEGQFSSIVKGSPSTACTSKFSLFFDENVPHLPPEIPQAVQKQLEK